MSNQGKRPDEVEFNTIVGKNIRYLRKSKKLTQTKVADAIGVSFQQVQKYEKGVNRVPIDILLAIGIKTKKEDINYFLPHEITDAEKILAIPERK